MKGRNGAKYFIPSELALLQECFDTLLARDQLERTSKEAKIMASALFMAYDRGISDKNELIRCAEFPRLVRTFA